MSCDVDFEYTLTPESIVFDVGAFEGDFTALMRSKYQCPVHAFEPCRESFRKLVARFKQDPLVWPYHFALEDTDKEGMLYIRNNSSSIYFGSDSQEKIQIRDIHAFIGSFRLPKIDLLKLNCEGSEYKILNRLIQVAWIKNVENIVVQFHSMPAGMYSEDTYKEEMERALSSTHKQEFKNDHWQWWKSHGV